MSAQIEARHVLEGDRIVWAGRNCTVTRSVRLLREKHAHRIWMSFDLDVPEFPPRMGVRYELNELISTWEPDPMVTRTFAYSA